MKHSVERTECYGADGVGKAEVMSEADVEWSSESFNVPGLQRNHDDGRGSIWLGGGEGERDEWIGLGTVGAFSLCRTRGF